MSVDTEKKEIGQIVTRLLDNLARTISSTTGMPGADLRRQIGQVRINYLRYMVAGTFATELQDCFAAARTANVKLDSLTYVHQRLFEETPIGDIAKLLVQLAINLCLATESRMITAITFVSRDDVEEMMRVMKIAFDAARDLAADAVDSASYQALTYLAGAVTNHLAKTARPLPRMITFKMATNYPALALSNRIYYEADRWEEIVDENHVVHPAFCLKDIRGLSA